MLRTRDVLGRLRRAGYRVSPGYLQYLLREGIVAPPETTFGRALVWEEPDIDRLRWALERRGRGAGRTEGESA